MDDIRYSTPIKINYQVNSTYMKKKNNIRRAQASTAVIGTIDKSVETKTSAKISSFENLKTRNSKEYSILNMSNNRERLSRSSLNQSRQKLYQPKVTKKMNQGYGEGNKQNNQSVVALDDIPFKTTIKDDQTFDELIATKYDDQLQSMDYNLIIIQEYKYRCSNPQAMRQERIYQFIYEKKSQNKMKYNSKSKINITALPVARGTVSVMLNVQKKDHGLNVSNFKNSVPTRSKFKMKWKTIQWLLNNRRDAIEQIFRNYNHLLKLAKKQKKSMNRDQFNDLLSSISLGGDINLADKLFQYTQLKFIFLKSIFDEDSSGTIDYKELLAGLEVFRDDSIDTKMKIFFDLCDVDQNGYITEDEMYKIFKSILLHTEDKSKLKKVIKEIFKMCDMNGDGILDKEELIAMSKNNGVLQKMMEESVRNVKQIDQMIENDLEEPFYNWVPASANFVNYKEGIHFPYVYKILDAFRESENIWEKNKKMKQINNPQKEEEFNYRQQIEDSLIEDA